MERKRSAASEPASPPKRKRCANPLENQTLVPKSVSLGDLLRAGKLVKPKQKVLLHLEQFDVTKCTWLKSGAIAVEIEEKKFSSGAFRDAFHARYTPTDSQTDQSNAVEWVVKKYQEKSLRTITEVLHMTVEDHTRKQVQMHSVARNIAQRFSARVPSQFGDCFRYGKVLNGVPITVEEFVEGEFVKYVNNHGNCYESDRTELDEIFEKAQSLFHFSYEFTEKKMMLLDLQESKYKHYDPEIATDQLQDFSGSEEYYFCAGNLT